MTISKKFLLALLTLVAVGVVGADWTFSADKKAIAPSARAPQAEGSQVELAPVDVTVVREASLNRTLQLSGILHPLKQSILTAEVEGRIQAVLVRPGDRVLAGQVLARMDSRDLENHLAEQRANFAASRAKFELAEKNHRRNEELLAKHFISAASLDTGRSTLDASRESMKAQDALVALTQQNVSKAVIRAPLDGIVAERGVEPGQHIALNTKLFVIVDLSELEFAANASVSEIGAISIGQEVTIQVTGVPELVVGHVERLAPTADDASRMIPVFIRVPNQDGSLKGGMMAQGRLRVENATGVLAVHKDTLRHDGKKDYVLRVGADRLERCEVTLGLTEQVTGLVEIKHGLAAGDQVILARLQNLEAGRQVVIRQ